MLLQSQVAGAEQERSFLSFKGFGSLIGTGTDTDKIGFRRDVSKSRGTTESWDITNDSRLGIQVDAKFTDTLQATVQWVARDHAGDFIEQNLDWAFLRWDARPDINIRLGRLGADVFMLSDYRNVGYAYPWIRPPHEFYGNLPFYHFDGLDLTKKFEVGEGFLSLKAFGGYTANTLPTSLEVLYDQEALVFGGNIQFEKDDWRLKAGYAHLELFKAANIERLSDVFKNPFLDAVWPGRNQVLPLLPLAGKELNYASLGAAYDNGTWLSQAEVSYIDSNTIWYPNQVSSYFSFGRRFSKLTVYSLLGITKSLNSHISVPSPFFSTPILDQLHRTLDTAVNSNSVDEKSVALGLRWDFYSNMAFKAQWSHYWLGAKGDRTWTKNSDVVFPQNANVFSVGIDFMF